MKEQYYRTAQDMFTFRRQQPQPDVEVENTGRVLLCSYTPVQNTPTTASEYNGCFFFE